MGRGNGEWTEAHARRVLDACDESGLSVAEFARREGIRARRLYRWRDRLEAEADGAATKASTANASFVPAVVKQATAVVLGRGATVAIETRSGARIEIVDPGRVSPTWIAAVVREMERSR